MLVATAGHVDHGKTSLIKHLTGTNTDRLAEEKERGLTIELGYAFSESAEGRTIGFIDVPGHHRFINTMISGITGIDLAMLVVAADDGPMPQTLEHLQLLRLLGVKKFVGVITKSDLVDRAQVEKISRELAALIPNAPLCEVSNRSGDGLKRLRMILDEQSFTPSERHEESLFRMYIDRVFIKKGVGVVVTGTCLAGTVKLEDEIHLHSCVDDNSPAIKVRVRAIHSQGKSASIAQTGHRCALNISGKVSLDTVHKGDFVCAHSTALPGHRLDTLFQSVDEPGQPLKHLGRVKLYIGTRRVSARTYILDRRQEVGAQIRLQLILDKPVLAFSGDRFVLREDNEKTTLGGGVVVDPEGPRWGKSKEQRLQQLAALELMDHQATLQQKLFVNAEVVSSNQCKRIWNLSAKELDQILAQPCFGEDKIVRTTVDRDQLLVASDIWRGYIADLDEHLSTWHGARPMEPGIQPESLQALLRNSIPSHLFKNVLQDCIRGGQVIRKDQLVHALGHRPTISHRVQREWQLLEKMITERGLNIPLRSELQRDAGFDARHLEALTRPAIKAGQLFEIGEKRLALPSTLMELAKRLEQFVAGSGTISVIEAKQVFGLGRNQTVEILEFFDQIGFTRRQDNARIVADHNAANLGP